MVKFTCEYILYYFQTLGSFPITSMKPFECNKKLECTKILFIRYLFMFNLHTDVFIVLLIVFHYYNRDESNDASYARNDEKVCAVERVKEF